MDADPRSASQPRGSGGSPSPEEAALIARARRVVGSNPPENRHLLADQFETKHIRPLRCFLDDAEPLIARLEAASVREAVEVYDRNDKTAELERKTYERLHRRLAWPIAIAIMLALLISIIQIPTIAEWIAEPRLWAHRSRDRLTVAEWTALLQQALPWTIYILLVGAPFVAFLLEPSLHYANWQSARGTAEAMRREIFNRVVTSDRRSPADMDPWSLLLRLEYFRRWQVELQQSYFRRRQAEHMRKVWLWRRTQIAYVGVQVLIFLFLFLSFLAALDEQGAPRYFPSLLAPLLARVSPWFSQFETIGVDYWLVVALLVTMAAAAYFYYQQTLGASLRNAGRYRNVLENFDALLEVAPDKDGRPSKLMSARLAAVRGDAVGVEAYMQRVHSIMSIENNDWVRLADLDRGIDRRRYDFDDQAPSRTS